MKSIEKKEVNKRMMNIKKSTVVAKKYKYEIVWENQTHEFRQKVLQAIQDFQAKHKLAPTEIAYYCMQDIETETERYYCELKRDNAVEQTELYMY